ncbi:MAG: HEAT repeat domain-containing protein [Verrucomicrobiae bacterium]|nr:HEAT repeat domain-containing protein [Verrucomicrobiae bacterium]
MGKINVFLATIALSAGISCFWQGSSANAQNTEDTDKILIQQVSKYQSGESAESLKKIEFLVREIKNNPHKKRQVEKILADILKNDSTIEARKFICQQLAIIGPESSLPVLSELAAFETTTSVACMAIVNSSSPEALDALLNAYGKGNLYTKIQIINSVGNLNWQRLSDKADIAVRFLESRLTEKEPVLVESSLTSLGKIGTKSAVQILLDFKSRNKTEFEHSTYDALLRCAEKAIEERRANDARTIYSTAFNANSPFHIRRAAFIGLTKTDSDGGIKRIEDTILGVDYALKPVAISLISKIGKSGVSGRIAKVFPRLGKDEQVFVIDALAEIGDSEALKTIEQSAESLDKDVRLSAIAALGKIGTSKHVPIMVKALNKSTEPASSQIIEQALCSLKGDDATDALILKELKSSTSAKARIINVLARRFALKPQSKLFASDGFKTLSEIATSDDSSAARAALRALGRLCSEQHLQPLLETLTVIKSAQIRGEAENATATLIERIQNKQKCELLLCDYLQKARSSEVKISFINLLPICGGSEAFSAVKSAYLSADTQIKEAGLRAIAEWKDMSAWEMLVGIYENPDSEAFRVLALRGLVRLLSEENIRADEKLVDKYRRLYSGVKSASDKKLIIGALSGCPHREALYFALEKMSDSDVKAEAVEAVRKIANSIKNKYPKEANEALEKVK